MNRTIALSLAALATAAAGHAYADDITIEAAPFSSSLSRAEVLADLQQFRSAGINPWADEYNPLLHFQGSKTSAQVIGEYIAGRAAVAALNSEDSGSAYMARREPAPQPTQLVALPVIE
jgi:hypothetical protein